MTAITPSSKYFDFRNALTKNRVAGIWRMMTRLPPAISRCDGRVGRIGYRENLHLSFTWLFRRYGFDSANLYCRNVE